MKKSWNVRFEELKAFRESQGHCRVRVRSGALGGWVDRQRAKYRKGNLEEDKILKLESIGFQWKLQYQRKPLNPVATDASDESFARMFEKVKAFKVRTGHCRIPQHYKDDAELGIWVKNRRMEKKKGTLREDRVEKLNSVGFVWEVKKRQKIKDTTVEDSANS